jgi:hypothetical protein
MRRKSVTNKIPKKKKLGSTVLQVFTELKAAYDEIVSMNLL